MLNSSNEVNLEQARLIAQDLAVSYRKYLENNGAVLSLLGANLEENNGTIPISVRKCFAFRIDFWDANTNRISKPYIAQIAMSANEIRYFESDPVQLHKNFNWSSLSRVLNAKLSFKL